MSLEDSPSLGQFTSDFSDQEPDFSPDKPKRGPRMAILILLVLALILGLINSLKSDQMATYLGKGTVSGHAVGADGKPIQVDVFVFDTAIEITSDEDGYFSIESLPKGVQSIIVSYGVIAAEVVVDVPSGGSVDLGSITVPTDINPE